VSTSRLGALSAMDSVAYADGHDDMLPDRATPADRLATMLPDIGHSVSATGVSCVAPKERLKAPSELSDAGSPA
jgi:hypothetical protein